MKPINKKKKTLEQEAQEFQKKSIPVKDIPSRDYFAGAALSGLISQDRSGRTGEDIVNQAFCYSCLMLNYKKNKDK